MLASPEEESVVEEVKNDISMKKYLLGELAESVQQELEQRLMTSNEYFEELLVAEDELVDEYLHGALSAHEQEKFDNHFLCTPERREKLMFSRSLQRYVSANAKRSPRTAWAWPPFFSFLRASYVTPGWSMATALLMMVLGGSWLSVRVQLLQHGLEQARNQRGTEAQELQQQVAQLHERNDQLTRQLQEQQRQHGALEEELAALRTPPPARSTASLVAFALLPVRLRDMGQATKVVIPPQVKWVELRLGLVMGDYKKYQAVLQNAEGKEIWSQSMPKVQVQGVNEALALALSTHLLARDDYILKLRGMDSRGELEDVATYQFRVEK
jgi:hypothetical protein